MTKEQIKARIKQLKKQKQRLEYLSESQDTRQHAYKIFLNSSYGVLGSVFYSCYDLDNAEAVTLSGQTVTREMVRFTNSLLNMIEGLQDQEYVIAGDTDSCDSMTKLRCKRLKFITVKLIIKGVERVIKFPPIFKLLVNREGKIVEIQAQNLKKTDKLLLNI